MNQFDLRIFLILISYNILFIYLSKGCENSKGHRIDAFTCVCNCSCDDVAFLAHNCWLQNTRQYLNNAAPEGVTKLWSRFLDDVVNNPSLFVL